MSTDLPSDNGGVASDTNSKGDKRISITLSAAANMVETDSYFVDRNNGARTLEP